MVVLAFAVGSAFIVLYDLGADRRMLPATVQVIVMVVVLVVTATVLARQARRRGWSEEHTIALAAGATLTYCWAGVLVQISLYGARPIGFVVQAVLITAALALLAVIYRKRNRTNMREGASLPDHHRHGN